MEIIGLITEYNPFHNGHKYHIDKIKEMYPDSLLICVTSTSFLERGEVSILNKWDKTQIALDNGIDIVIELPFAFSSQSADIFASGALTILNYIGVKKIVFGSECNDIEKLTRIAKQQLEDKTYDKEVKKYLKEGINYPTALSKALDCKVDTPNDLLAISYIKEILKHKYPIIPITIKRTNDYHDKAITSNIISATAVRNLLKEKKDISLYVPKNVSHLVYQDIDIFPLLKYKILSDAKILHTFQTVDEGIENRILKGINKVNSLSELILFVKTKRYTYNKINRMFIHILTSFTKEEAKDIEIDYIRILGFNKNGKAYLNKIKKETKVPLITSYKEINSSLLDLEYRVTGIYSELVNNQELVKRELEKPIIH